MWHTDIETLFLLHKRELEARLRQIVRCADTAADLVQEAYLRLLQTATVRTITHPRGFLFRAATHLALDHLKAQNIRREYATAPHPASAAPLQSPSAEHVATDRQHLGLLRQAIADLPPRCREAFILHKLHGLPYRDIATPLGISQSAVEKHIIKGLLACQRALRSTASRGE